MGGVDEQMAELSVFACRGGRNNAGRAKGQKEACVGA